MSYRDATPGAPWRTSRLTQAEFFSKLRTLGIKPSTLFSCPALDIQDIVLDWLHIVDLGVAQDLLGSFFKELVLEGLAGNNKEKRLALLWTAIRDYYRKAKPTSRLGALTLEMFEKSGTSSKLRAKGGETRGLLPFAAEFSKEVAEYHQTTHWKTVAAVFDLLFKCAQLCSARPFDQDSLKDHCRKLCLLWSGLEREAQASGSKEWNMKPKAHMFQELCEFVSQDMGTPEHFWTYKDESWCGIIAKSAKKRGGQNNAATIGARLLQRYRAWHHLINTSS
jgi:hypothetical protein